MSDIFKHTEQHSTPEGADSRPFVVGLGASAGGIKALKDYFARVPPQSGAAYAVILHLSPDHDSRLAEVLQTTAPMPVTQVTGPRSNPASGLLPPGFGRSGVVNATSLTTWPLRSELAV